MGLATKTVRDRVGNPGFFDELSSEQGREAAENVVAFVSILHEWAAKDARSRGNESLN
jgi:hypothetical protein